MNHMKRIVLSVLLLCACIVMQAQNYVSVKEAKTAAVHFLQQRVGNVTCSEKTVLAVHENKVGNRTLIYEVMFDNNMSVLLTGVKSCKAVIGYRNRTGGVSVLNQVNSVVSPGMNIFLEKCREQISYAIETQRDNAFIHSEWKQLLRPGENNITAKGGIYGPYLTSAWGQTRAYPKTCDGYNYYVTETVDQCKCASISKCPTGCVATAMAQIIRYWQYPARSPYTGEAYEWANMCDTLKAASPHFEVERKAIARLMRDCGLSAGTHYCYAPNSYGCQSFAWPTKARDGFVNQFCFSEKAERKLRSSHNTKIWKQLIIDEIVSGNPVLYGSASLAVKDFAECGHAYVCDGYNENTDMFHFNWGYDGEANGWYSLDDLVIKLSKHNYNWNHFERMVIHIYPSFLEEIKNNNTNNGFVHISPVESEKEN